MKKRWTILWVSLLIASSLFFVYLRFNSAVPRFYASSEAAAENEGNCTHWHRTGVFRKPRGVAVVVHGLNLKPERMDSLIALLNRAGIDALGVSLHGHGENYLGKGTAGTAEARLDSFRAVTSRLWSAELYEAYRKARQRARQIKVPVFLIGYSLGGLLGCELQVSRPDVSFDRMVLFAPALKITLKPHLLKALMPFPDLVIDSLAPVDYRANAGTPMAGYKAMFDTLNRFEKNLNGKLNVPTIVFLDREDEFISYEGLREMIAEEGLDRWRIIPVRKSPSENALFAHHLLIDETVVGKEMWSKMDAALLSHLISSDRKASHSQAVTK